MSDESMHSALVGPGSDWWKPAGRQEKVWVTVSFIWCIFMFAAMPFWHFKGGQNPSGTRGKVDPMAFYARTQKFIEDYQVVTDEGPLTEQGIPVVEPPAGSEVYLLGQMWMWSPVLKLKKGVEYTIHLSSLDLNHGFGLFPVNINIQVVPGYDYALKMTPTQSGEFKIICNEFCGIGHHLMIGKIIVED